MVIGLTGGSGCGKTTALEVLRKLGAECHDADAVYRELLTACPPMLAQIEKEFPGTVRDGVLQRRVLAAKVFHDPAALRRLSAVTHPYVVEEIRRRLGGGLSVIDAFGLVESGLAALCDVTVAVIAPTEARIERIMRRDGVSREAAAERIAAQRSNEEFSALCDLTLENSGSQEEFRNICKETFEKLTEEREQDG